MVYCEFAKCFKPVFSRENVFLTSQNLTDIALSICRLVLWTRALPTYEWRSIEGDYGNYLRIRWRVATLLVVRPRPNSITTIPFSRGYWRTTAY